jgi:hypothetical protein
MHHILTLLILCCAAMHAADSALPPKVDQAYRAYLAALAKAYQSETTKINAELARDAVAAKKDPDALAAITALQEKIKAGKQLGDLGELVGAAGGGDLITSPEKITGGLEALYGKWAIQGNMGFDEWTITYKPNGTAIMSMVTKTSRSDYTYNWKFKDGVVRVDGTQGPVTSVYWDVPLPLPMTGPATVTRHLKSANSDSQNDFPILRVPDAPAAK